MRFIIREQDFERHLAAGKFQYLISGAPIGIVEEWRLTEAGGGYRFLRVDLDRREDLSGESTLFHLVLNQNRTPERLKFHHFGQGNEISGDVLFSLNSVLLTCRINGDRYETEVDIDSSFQNPESSGDLSSGWAFWFPSALGLALPTYALGQGNRSYEIPVISLTLPWLTGYGKSDKGIKLVRQTYSVSYHSEESVAIGRDAITARPLSITAGDFGGRIWFDQQADLPVRLVSTDGFSAVETRYIRPGNFRTTPAKSDG